MHIAISLDWDYCPGGYEIHDYGDPPPPDAGPGSFGPNVTRLYSKPYGVYLRPISDEVATRHFELDAVGSVVIPFLNARTNHQLLNFCRNHGMPSAYLPNAGVRELRLNEICELQTRIEAVQWGKDMMAPGALARVFHGPMVNLGLS